MPIFLSDRVEYKYCGFWQEGLLGGRETGGLGQVGYSWLHIDTLQVTVEPSSQALDASAELYLRKSRMLHGSFHSSGKQE